MGETHRVQLTNAMPDEEYLNRIGAFKDRAQMIRMMSDKEYRTNPAYRAMIERAIQNSDPVALGLEQPAPEEDNTETMETRVDAARQAFGDPRYKTSALYRRQVADMIAELPSAPLPPGKTHRIQITGDTGEMTKITGFQSLCIQSPGQPSGPNKPQLEVKPSGEREAEAAQAKPKMGEDWQRRTPPPRTFSLLLSQHHIVPWPIAGNTSEEVPSGITKTTRLDDVREEERGISRPGFLHRQEGWASLSTSYTTKVADG